MTLDPLPAQPATAAASRELTCCGGRGCHVSWCRSDEACAATATAGYLASLDAERWDAPAEPPTIHTTLVGALRHERGRTDRLASELADVRLGFLARGNRILVIEAEARRLRDDADAADRTRMVAQRQRDSAAEDARRLRADLSAVAELLGLPRDAAGLTVLGEIRRLVATGSERPS